MMKRKKIVEVKEIARLPEHVVNRVAAGEVRDETTMVDAL
jgi:DNA mismatch repair ATPase MutL|tara:strand:+ start:140 stop:259 length:120 start_codon:yes stop_codon:yes gene_type:complete